MKKFLLYMLSMVMLGSLLTGCSLEKQDTEKIKDLDFTVVEEEKVPEELKKVIDEKKQNEFKVTFTDQNYLYIVVGYGEQKTGGYSISVNELYLTDNAVYIDTNLIGPTKGETTVEAPSYPYVVVKLEQREETVVFQ